MKKFQCMIEGCDCPHCPKCGKHYEPCAETVRYNRCDRCIVQEESDFAEGLTVMYSPEEVARILDE